MEVKACVLVVSPLYDSPKPCRSTTSETEYGNNQLFTVLLGLTLGLKTRPKIHSLAWAIKRTLTAIASADDRLPPFSIFRLKLSWGMCGSFDS